MMEDFRNDWIPNDYNNSHGIHIFIRQLNHQSIIVENKDKIILFQWFCFWLLPHQLKPKLQLPYDMLVCK